MCNLLLLNSVSNLTYSRFVTLAVSLNILEHLHDRLHPHNALPIHELLVLFDHAAEVQQPHVVLLRLLTIVEHAYRAADEPVALELLED